MIRITKTFTRPSKSVQWYSETTAGVQWSIYRTKTKGALLSNPSTSISEDGLTLVYSVNWASQEAFDARLSDETYNAGIEARKAYNAQNGITESQTQIVSL